MKSRATYRSLKFLCIFWVIKFCLVFCMGVDNQEMQLEEPQYMYLVEYLESAFYIAMMFLAGFEDIIYGSKQLKLVILLTILMGVLMEKLVMIATMSLMGVIGILFLAVVGMAVFGPSVMVVFGLVASWLGVLGPIALIAFLVSSIFSGFALYG